MTGNDELNRSESTLGEYGQEKESAALPLGVGGFESEGVDTLSGVEDEGGKSRAGQILLILVVLVAAGGLFFMRSLAKVTVAATSADDERILEEFLNERGDVDGSGSVAALRSTTLEVLTETYQERQVPLDDVQKNPFEIENETKTTSEGPVVDSGRSEIERQLAAAVAAFEQAISRLELKSVMMGSNPVANISGNVVRVGDFVSQDGIRFEVTEITAKTADLKARKDDPAVVRTFTLEIKRP